MVELYMVKREREKSTDEQNWEMMVVAKNSVLFTDSHATTATTSNTIPQHFSENLLNMAL